MRNNQILKDTLLQYKVEITDFMTMQFEQYYDIMIEWNQFMNLTAITNYEEVLMKHFIDSLSLFRSFGKGILQNSSLLDIGTGAGFPGLPLKITIPELNVTLLDSLNKRVKFLNYVILKLELKDISAIHGRAEERAKEKEYRKKFDFVVSRAVSKLSVLAEYCLPFVKQGGFFIAFKSNKVKEELEEAKTAIEVLGGRVQEVTEFYLPGTDQFRSHVIIKKIKETSKIYPRITSKILKQPLFL